MLDISTLFDHARTFSAFTDKPVSVETLHAIYEHMKWGPTSANCCPLRIVFVRSEQARQKLFDALDAGNVPKSKSAPVTAVLGMDMNFYEHLPVLYPHTDARAWYVGKEAAIARAALQGSSLQGAYFMMAARALGLDCGPMGGFNAERMDKAFWSGTTVKTNFVCNLGYGDRSRLHPRLPRLSFDQVCRLE